MSDIFSSNGRPHLWNADVNRFSLVSFLQSILTLSESSSHIIPLILSPYLEKNFKNK